MNLGEGVVACEINLIFPGLKRLAGHMVAFSRITRSPVLVN